jgi:glycosyltransferase involved in cell wall biosynthesis
MSLAAAILSWNARMSDVQLKRPLCGAMMPVRVVHVVAGIGPADGGPSYTVPRLCRALADAGVRPTLLSVAPDAAEPAVTCNRGNDQRSFVWDHATIPVLRELRVSSALSSELAKEAIRSDVIHNHGLWLMPNVYAGWAASRARRPLVVAPRGMLGGAALQFSRMKKVLFWQLLQGPAIHCAACFHATSGQEYEDIRAYGLTQPVAIIPNGIDLPQSQGHASGAGAADRLVLSLGRIHPKKGLDRLVHAWGKVEAAHPGWRLRIVGPSEVDHEAQLRTLVATLKLGRVSIEPAIYGEEKCTAFREADFFVLPTLNENFAMTVAESLAAGTPVISTKGAPWAGLEVERCGWWIDHGIEPLAAALSDAMVLPRTELRAMGARGQAWVARDFGWDAIASKMAAVYAWLAGTADPPEWVSLA